MEELQNASVHQGDETYWKNLGKGAKKRFWLGSVRSGRVTRFEVFDSRAKTSAQKFLKGLHGFLLTDGFPGYFCLASDSLILCNDWCHVRRKFLLVEKTHPAESLFFMNQIRLLFAIKERTKDSPLPDKKLIRSQESKPIIQVFYDYCLQMKNVLPQSPLGKAIDYTLKLWKGLTVFLDHPEVPLHTNEIERAQRPAVIGRKNHYGSKNLESVQIASVWYTLLATCEMNQVEPYPYLLDTIRAILSKKPVETPWQWKLRQKSQFDTS
jgi:hypothetical protein